MTPDGLKHWSPEELREASRRHSEQQLAHFRKAVAEELARDEQRRPTPPRGDS